MREHQSEHPTPQARFASHRMLRDVMTRDPAFVRSRDTVQRAAQLMADLNVGALPVCEHGHIAGMITDRDLSIRCVAAGKGPHVSVGEVMTEGAHWCRESDALDVVCETMCREQIRRVPVVDDQQQLVGMVSMGDLVTKAGDAAGSGRLVSEVSTPSKPSR